MSTPFYTSTNQNRLRTLPRDLYRYKGLLRDLVWKELRARYRNAMMGLLWAVLQPVLMMLILTLVFGYLLRSLMAQRGLMAGEHQYAVFLLCGLVPWQFLAISLACGTQSLVENQELIKKVHFPREIIPLAAVMNCVVNVAIGFATLLVVLVALEGPSALGPGILLVPFIFAIQFALIAGLALLLSAMNVYYRDVGYMVEVALAFGFYATPVFYALPSNINPTFFQIYMLNPMANLVTAYRQALLDNQFPELLLLIRPALFAAIALGLGTWFFRRCAPTFPDHF